jgi:preprotein translocase subunit SecG
MRVFLLVFHLLLTLVMIGVILIQRGEDASAGSGSGGGLPGSRSSKSILTRVTGILAAIFFFNCVWMAILVRRDSKLGTAQTAQPKKRESLDNKLDQKPGKFGSVMAPHKILPLDGSSENASEKIEKPVPLAAPSLMDSPHPAPVLETEAPTNKLEREKAIAQKLEREKSKKRRSKKAKLQKSKQSKANAVKKSP